MTSTVDRLRAFKPSASSVDLFADTFPQQRAMCEDHATFAAACCSRRAGKSEGIARTLLSEMENGPCLYFTTTRKEAKRIIWPLLKAVITKHRLPLEPIESELVIKRNGQPMIFLTGCDNATEIGKMRGSGWRYVAGDEAQLFPQYIKPLVEETLSASLMDFDGRVLLSGTPGPVPVGYFYDAMQPKSAWSRHSWTVWDNPFIPQVKKRKKLDETLAVRGITEEHPSIQREFFGRWVYDQSALVFAYSERNDYGIPPLLTDYVLGVDLGFDDADAIAVLGWTEKRPELYLVEEHVLAKQSITELTAKIRELHAKYDPLATVVDTGGLGKKIADEIRKRTAIPLEAADKVRKLEHIELLNDALRSGRMFARKDSRFAQDSLLVEWDRSNPEKPKISDRFHSDICDAVLYAYMRALHWLHEPAAPGRADVGTLEWAAEEEREMEERLERRIIAEQEQVQEFGSYR